jgi:hypothetical protein
MFADIFSQESQDKAAVFLQQSVLPAVTAVSLKLCQVLWPVQFDRHMRFGAIQIHLHLPFRIKRDGQLRIQSEATGGLRQRFQPAVQESLTRASGASNPLGLGGETAGGMDKEAGQRGVHTVMNEPAHACGVISFPFWINWQRHFGRPPGYRAARQLD